jgi:hypothetical protein
MMDRTLTHHRIEFRGCGHHRGQGARQVIRPVRIPWTVCLAFVLAAALGSVLGGCHSPSQYVSPRVTGRVLNEQTRQPIQNVQVRRQADKPSSLEPPKGGQLLMQAPYILTEADGNFALKSERALAFLWRVRWYSVTLSFAHRGYETLAQTFTLAHSTNTPAGEPLVEAGDILLKPLQPKE